MESTCSPNSDSERSAWMGFDVAARKFDASVRLTGTAPLRPAEIRLMPVQEFERSKQGLKKAVKWAKSQFSGEEKLHLVMEATGHYSAEIAAWMRDAYPQIGVTVTPALTMKNYISGIGLRNKTDKLDARAIACYGAQCQPEASADHDQVYLQLRALTRTAQAFAERATEIKNQIHANDSDHVPARIRGLIHKADQQQLALLEKNRKMLEKEMREVVSSDSRLRRDVELLCTIQGIGFLSAVTALGELGDLRKYKTSRQLTACTGLNPVIHQSGEKVGKSHISKQGSSHLRRCLYLNAMVAMKHNQRLSERHQNLIGRGKPPKVALTANMRVLLTIMRAVLVSGKPYDPQYLQSQNQNHQIATPDKALSTTQQNNQTPQHAKPVDNTGKPWENLNNRDTKKRNRKK